MMDGSHHDRLFHWPGSPPSGDRPSTFCVIGVPADHGNGVSRGAAGAPGAIRRAAAQLVPPRCSGIDMGDQAGCGSADLDTVLTRLASTTDHIVEHGMRPLVIGGDHSITYAPVSVLQRRQPIGVVWFDAHTDFSPWSEGEVHSHKQVLRRIDALSGVTRVIQIGYRGLTACDERQLGGKAIVLTAADARELDGTNLLSLMSSELPWYISIDIDAVDPFHAPGTSAPVPDGLEPSRIRELLTAIVSRRSLLGADVVEVNPRLDVDDLTSAIAASFLWTIADNWGSLAED